MDKRKNVTREMKKKVTKDKREKDKRAGEMRKKVWQKR